MLLNAQNLAALTQGFRSNFNTGFNMAKSYWEQVATLVPSSTAKESYPWLGDLPGIREWIGDRQIHKLEQHDYTIKNIAHEMTVGVKRDAIADDTYGVYSPLMSNMGFETRVFPDVKVFGLLAAAFDTECYDGQPMCDDEHPGFDAAGAEALVSNMQAGAGAPWFLMDTRRPLKPLIYQEREKFNFVALVDMKDENVFMRKEFLYGVDGRANVGFGFWQQIFGSKATLDATNFNAAYAAMGAFKKRSGAPLGVKPNLLVCGPSNRAKALEVVKAERNAAGATNINRDAVDVLVVEYLT